MRHDLPEQMLQICLLHTPNITASLLGVNPAARNARIKPTSPSESLRPGMKPRPFALRSIMLSRCVPRNRWLGRTHGGLSQTWQTCSPRGIGPFSSSHAMRCTPTVFPRRAGAAIHPYPLLSVYPRQTQQCSVLSTRFHIRSSGNIEPFFGMRHPSIKSRAKESTICRA